jgi:GNAT superfamily N-acetyltransferase
MPSNLPIYTVIKAIKADKKDIMRFYKAQHYAASYIGQDQCYFIKVDEKIIACAIVSAGQGNGEFWLLHALVTDQQHRGKGIASLLLNSIKAEKKPVDIAMLANNTVIKSEIILLAYAKVICFADQKLQRLYVSNQFIVYNSTTDISQLPNEFQQRLSRYREKQKRLCCYIFCNDK